MIDPLTKTEFTASRSNQKFATARNRTTYHNQIATAVRQKKAFVDKYLRINFRILHELLPQNTEPKEKVFHKQFLVGKGFSFGVHTHLEDESGKSHFAVYNYIVIPLAGEQVKIVRK